MNPDTTLLLVGGNDETVQKAKQLGLHVLLLQHPSKLSAEQERLADVIRVLDYTEWAEVEPAARALRQSPGFAAALSITEAGLENAVRAPKDHWDRLGLVAVTGPDAAAAIRRGAELISDTVDIRIAGADNSGSRGRVSEVENLAHTTGGAA